MNKELEALERMIHIALDYQGKEYARTELNVNLEDYRIVRKALTPISNDEVEISFNMINKSFDKWAERDDYDKQDNLAYFSLLKLQSKFKTFSQLESKEVKKTITFTQKGGNKEMFKYHLYRAIIHMKNDLDYTKEEICIICELEDEDYDEILTKNK